MEIAPYPLLCEPLLKDKIWGGQRLRTLLNRNFAADRRVGESWEVADLPEGTSRVANGPLKGKTLVEVTRMWGRELIGTEWAQSRFPLLVKFIDANEDLSIQVHPSDEDCRRWFPEERGKEETWVVVDAVPEAKVIHGFQEGTTERDLDQHLSKPTVLDLLRRVEVKRGDVLRTAPGTVHTLCAGVVVLEIQQPSDSTFRIYDYGRNGPDGRPRPLHTEQARAVVRLEPDTGPIVSPKTTDETWGRRELLVDGPEYWVERLIVSGRARRSTDRRSFQAVVALQGEPTLRWADGTLPLDVGESVIVPASMSDVEVDSVGAEAVVAIAGIGRAHQVMAGRPSHA